MTRGNNGNKGEQGVTKREPVLTVCQSDNGHIERELFRNSSGFRFNVNFVDWTSVLVLEASLNFTYIL